MGPGFGSTGLMSPCTTSTTGSIVSSSIRLKSQAADVRPVTNVVWVEQPVGTGYSQINGSPEPTNEVEMAEQFLSWWRNFVDNFGLHGRKVFIAGESYAGYYVPYIADAMHNETDKAYYDIDSLMIYDPSVNYDVVTEDIPAVPFVEYHQHLFNFNDTFMEDLRSRADSCGYTEFMDMALSFPPNGTFPSPPNVNGDQPGCNLWEDIYTEAMWTNPCWDVSDAFRDWGDPY